MRISYYKKFVLKLERKVENLCIATLLKIIKYVIIINAQL